MKRKWRSAVTYRRNQWSKLRRSTPELEPRPSDLGHCKQRQLLVKDWRRTSRRLTTTEKQWRPSILQSLSTENTSFWECPVWNNTTTHFGHRQLTIFLEKEPPHAHSNQIGAKSGPRLVVDFVKKGKRIVRSRHVAVAVRNVPSCDPRAYHEDQQEASAAFEMANKIRRVKIW